MANSRAFFPLARVRLSRSEQARGIVAAREYRAKRRFDFSEYTEECCSPFEFDMFTFVSVLQFVWNKVYYWLVREQQL